MAILLVLRKVTQMPLPRIQYLIENHKSTEKSNLWHNETNINYYQLIEQEESCSCKPF